MIHELKCDPAIWPRLWDGSKTFELRRDDRGFQTGDELVLREYRKGDHDCNEPVCYQNWRDKRRASLRYRVGFVAKGTFYGLELGEHAILSLVLLSMKSADPDA